MKLKIKKLGIKTGGHLVALLHEKNLQELDIVPGDRIEIKKGKKKYVAIVDSTNQETTIKKNEIGLFTELINGELKEKLTLEIKPQSINAIKEKLDGKELTNEETKEIIKDLIENRLTEIETTYFIAGCYKNGMTLNESKYLTEAIVNGSKKLEFKGEKVVDKHCIGGVPSNRTTMVVVPIIATAGLLIPKTSTRSITSVAGTADTMEVLAPIKHTKEQIKAIVKKTNGCMVWGGTLDLASADDMLIKFERTLSLDPQGILLASILAKKASVGAKYVLIDIPIGPQAKVKTKKEAKELKNKFIRLGKKLDIKVKVMFSDGSEPIGNGIGPALEARDVLLVLQNNGPKDLRKKSLKMAGMIMQMAGIKFAKLKAYKILRSGKAYEKMKEIIKAQGGNEHITPERIKLGQWTTKIKAKKTGRVIAINNKILTRIGKRTGAPNEKGAGIYLHKKKNQIVEKGQPLYTIYAEKEEKKDMAEQLAKENSGYTIK